MQRLNHITTLLCTAMLLAFNAPSPAHAQRPVALPVDEASNDKSFFAFRQRLIFHVEEQDVEAIIASSCPDIEVSFGVDAGHDAFRAFLTMPEHLYSDEYKPQIPEIRAKYWADLLTVLSLGGRFGDQGEFWAPYTWTAEVPADYDAFTTYFITGADVLARNKPNKEGVAIDSLSYNIVTVPWYGEVQYDKDAEYWPIEQPNGTVAYVHRDFLRSQVDYRALFEKDAQGDWKMCVFIAGD